MKKASVEHCIHYSSDENRTDSRRWCATRKIVQIFFVCRTIIKGKCNNGKSAATYGDGAFGLALHIRSRGAQSADRLPLPAVRGVQHLTYGHTEHKTTTRCRLWSGREKATVFHPLVARRSKVTRSKQTLSTTIDFTHRWLVNGEENQEYSINSSERLSIYILIMELINAFTLHLFGDG